MKLLTDRRVQCAVRGTVYAALTTATLGYIAGGLWVGAVIWS